MKSFCNPYILDEARRELNRPREPSASIRYRDGPPPQETILLRKHVHVAFDLKFASVF